MGHCQPTPHEKENPTLSYNIVFFSSTTSANSTKIQSFYCLCMLFILSTRIWSLCLPHVEFMDPSINHRAHVCTETQKYMWCLNVFYLYIWLFSHEGASYGRQGPNPKWVPATHTVVMMILWFFEPYDLGLIWSILPHHKCDLSKMLRVEIHIRKRELQRHLLFLRVTQSFFLCGAQHLWMPSVSAQHSPITCIIGEKNG